MRNAQEMLRFAQKSRAAAQKCYRSAFTEVEKNLDEGEAVVFSATGDGYARNEEQMMWYTVLAVTEKRLLVGGQRMKGMIMVRYEVESFPLSNISRIGRLGAKLVIQTAAGELKIEEGNSDTAEEIAKELKKAAALANPQNVYV